MARKPYPTDVTDAQWALVGPMLPAARPGGRPRSVDLREVLNAILYVNRAGNAWRLLPREFPPWQTVYWYFRLFQRDGTWRAVHDRLRGAVRLAAGRRAEPSAAILDSQSVKTAGQGGRAVSTRASASRAASGTWRWTRRG
jgi:putative transposase